MKFTTFRNLIVCGAVSGVFGSLYFCGKSASPPADKPAVVSTTPAQPTPVAPSPPDTAKPKADDKAPSPAETATTKSGHALVPLRPGDEEVLRLLSQPPSGDKSKDATPGRPYKVNLYAEGGKYVRAKVDLNRNGKWDEKWSIEEKNGERVIKRQASPNDDDTNYPDKFKLRDKAWEKTEP